MKEFRVFACNDGFSGQAYGDVNVLADLAAQGGTVPDDKPRVRLSVGNLGNGSPPLFSTTSQVPWDGVEDMEQGTGFSAIPESDVPDICDDGFPVIFERYGDALIGEVSVTWEVSLFVSSGAEDVRKYPYVLSITEL